MKEKYNKFFCQHCGCERKLVETLIDDEALVDEKTGAVEYMGFTDDFEHTGRVICAGCHKDWTGEVV